MDPGTRLGPYEIREHLGAGGMGEVYRAHDPRLKRDVAIKRLPSDAGGDAASRRELLNEARSSARISDQNVATVHDVFEESEQLFLVMELVDGITLRERLFEPITVDQALDIAIQSAQGIAAAHREGVVHRDIKPDNIMITGSGTVKVLDFGVATLPAGMSADTATATSIVASDQSSPSGTVPFMAPEVLLGEESDERADVFSLGITLYAMLTGAHPFAAKTGAGTVDRILNQDPEVPSLSNPGSTPALDRAVARMLAKRPDDRQQSMEVVLQDLRRARSELTSPGRPAGEYFQRPEVAATGGGSRGSSARRWGAVVGAVALALVAYWFLGIRPEGAAPSPGAARFDATDWVIAVLPAESAETDAEMVALRQGLAATLTSMLAQMSRAHDLQVIPASAIAEREIKGFLQARQELGVTLAIDFQLRRAGDRLRVNVNLIDTAAERQLEAATIDGSVDDPIDLEEQVALRALRMLRIELLPMERGVLEAGTDEPRAHGYYLRATGYLQEYGDPESIDSAVTLLEQALQVDPDYARAHAALGEAFWHRYRETSDVVWVDRALSECEAAVETAPTDGAGFRCRGTVLNGTGELATAAEALEQARRLDPTDDGTYIALGSVYENQGETRLAEATYQEAVNLRPHYWGGYSWLGRFYLRAGRVDEAISKLQEVVALAPDSYRGFSNLGVAYYVAQDWTQARRAFERSLELKPDYSRAISNLGTLYFFEGDYAASAEMFEQAVEASPDNYLAWGNLGDAHYWTPGQRSRSAAAYRRGLDLAAARLTVNPSDGVLASHMARYHAMLGEPEASRRLLEQALSNAPTNNDVVHSAAQIEAILGDDEAALDYLRRSIEAGYQRAEIAVDPTFANLRQSPAYRALLEE